MTGKKTDKDNKHNNNNKDQDPKKSKPTNGGESHKETTKQGNMANNEGKPHSASPKKDGGTQQAVPKPGSSKQTDNTIDNRSQGMCQDSFASPLMPPGMPGAWAMMPPPHGYVHPSSVWGPQGMGTLWYGAGEDEWDSEAQSWQDLEEPSSDMIENGDNEMEIEEIHDINPDGDTGPQDEDIDLLANHRARYLDEDGTPVSPHLASLINTMWDKGRDKNLMKECYERHARPDNVNVHKIDMNEEIISTLPKFARTRDIRLRAIQGGVARAVVPVMKLIDTQLGKTQQSRQQQVDTAMDAVALLASTNAAINQLRREFVRPHIHKKYHALCSRAPPASSPYLLGDDLNDKIKQANQANQMARGRGSMNSRGMRYQPYVPYPTYSYAQGYGFGRGRGRPGRGGFLGEYKITGKTILRTKTVITENTNTCREIVDNILTQQDIKTKVLTDKLLPTFCACRTETRTREDEPGPGREQEVVPQGEPSSADNTENEEVGECRTRGIMIQEKVFEAGGISRCFNNWRRLTSDRKMLSDIRGYKIEFSEFPEQIKPAHEIRFSRQEREFVRTEIENLLEKGVLVEVDHEDGEYISNIFLREKKDPGKFRMILNLKKLNYDVEHQHFKIDTLQIAIELVKRNCWFISLDFSDAYYSLAVHPADRKYLRFTFEGRLLEYTCVPMGLKTGPRLFTKVLKIPLAYLRERKGVTISGYLDDTLILSDSKERAVKDGQTAADLFQDLGYVISPNKSVLVPTQEIEFLGFIINSRDMQVSMTEKKVKKIENLLRNFQKENFCPIRFIARVLGKLNATLPANPYTNLFTRRLEIAKTNALKEERYQYDAIMRIPENCKEDIQWWLENLADLARPIQIPNPDYVIFTDASLEGWGCHDKEEQITFGGKWTREEKMYHINYLELLAIFFGLKATCGKRNSLHVRIKSDNTTAVCAIQKQGSTHSELLNELARKIWLYAMDRELWISAEHCAGVINTEADKGSRVFREETEWTISQKVFQELTEMFGKPDMDMFASRLNYKLKPFCAWQPDPEADCIDAFLQDWGGKNIYVFPPFAIISRVLQKFQMDGAKGIIIVPYWPTKPWFTRFAELIIREPCLIPTTKKYLFLPSSDREHALSRKLMLVGALCSADHSEQKVFREQLQTPYSAHDASHQPNYMRPTGDVGKHIAVKNSVIRLNRILGQP